MKKPKPLEIKEDRSLQARRRARQAVGAVKPARVITPKVMKDPRHKKVQLDDPES
ncbi:MAG: hypothetical protein QM757_47245 [Paludibaculum sp.]